MVAKILKGSMHWLVVSSIFATHSLLAVSATASIIGFEGFLDGEEITGGDLGGVIFDVTTTSVLNAAAIYDSNSSGGADPDLEVGLGNLLIIQNQDFPTKVGDIYSIPDDELAGGTIKFTFSMPIELLAIDLVDIDANAATTITLTDIGGFTRTYSVPDDWTGEVGVGNDGYGTLSLLTTTPQIDNGPSATAATLAGYDPTTVSMMSVVFDGSGGLDNLEYTDLPPTGEPAPEATSLLVWSVLTAGAMLYRPSKTDDH